MRSPRRVVDARARARSVLAELQISRTPIPVEYIAERKGIVVRAIPLESDLSGMIFIKNSVPVIVVNDSHHANRRRFTIAHEIGHFELHMQDIGEEVHVDKTFFPLARDSISSMGFDRKEIEANRFAAELLVPRDLLVSQLRGRNVDVEEEDDDLIEELARLFQVSKQMMSIRIGELLG